MKIVLTASRIEAPMRAEKAGRARVEIYAGVDELVISAGKVLFDQLRRKPGSVIGLATGSTFVPFYEYVSLHYREAGVSFRDAVTFNLDEYYPISGDSRDSYHSYMAEHLFSRVDMKAAGIHIPDGSAADPDAEAEAYEKAIKSSGGIDLQFLGLGRNGHIGFNEPGTPFTSRTHKTVLSESTLSANAPIFGDKSDMPGSALTMGIGTITDSRKIVLLAFGRQKSKAVRETLKGEITEEMPASCLRRHRDTVFMIDEEAAAELHE